MRLIDLVAAICLMTAFVGAWTSCIPSLRKVYGDFKENSAAYGRDRFITDSFRRMCREEKNSPEEFDDWIAMCSSMWDLEDLTVKVAGRKDGKTLFICEWKAGGEKIEKSIGEEPGLRRVLDFSATENGNKEERKEFHS